VSSEKQQVFTANQLEYKYIVYFSIIQSIVHYLGYQIINYHKLPLFLRYKIQVMKSYISALFTVLVLIAFQGCKKDSDKNPDPVLSGKITGQLRLTDELGVELSDNSNMGITTEAGSVGNSTAAGTYEINNLASGTYNLIYSKVGYGTYKRFNVQVLSGSNATILNGIDFLGQKSTTEISALDVNFNAIDSTYNIECSIAPVPDAINQRAFRLFFGKTNTISAQDYQFTPSNTWLSSTASGQITGYPRSQLYNNGFTAGETVYVIAYGESIRTNSYTDPLTNKKVFPNINLAAPSNVVTFVLQ